MLFVDAFIDRPRKLLVDVIHQPGPLRLADHGRHHFPSGDHVVERECTDNFEQALLAHQIDYGLLFAEYVDDVGRNILR